MSWILFAAGLQALVLAVSAIVIFFQTRALVRISKANFQHEIFRNIVEQRTLWVIEATKAFTSPPFIQEMLKVADNSPQMLARIRGMLDLYYDAFKLYKGKFIDQETWNTFEYLISTNLQSSYIADVWKLISQTNAFSQDFIQVVNNLSQRDVKITGTGSSQDIRP